MAREITAAVREVHELHPMGYRDLVVVADGDHQPDAPRDPVMDLVRSAVAAALPGFSEAGDPPWQLPHLLLEVVSMRAGPDQAEGVPTQECLERVIVAAFARAYPSRFTALREWLARRPDPKGSATKAASWSVMAGWFADGGCADFLRRGLWQDVLLRGEVERTLQATRLIRVGELLEAP